MLPKIAGTSLRDIKHENAARLSLYGLVPTIFSWLLTATKFAFGLDIALHFWTFWSSFFACMILTAWQLMTTQLNTSYWKDYERTTGKKYDKALQNIRIRLSLSHSIWTS